MRDPPPLSPLPGLVLFGFVLVFGVVWGVCWWELVGLVGVLGLVWTRVVGVDLELPGFWGGTGLGRGSWSITGPWGRGMGWSSLSSRLSRRLTGCVTVSGLC